MPRFLATAALTLLLASCGDAAGPGAGAAEKLIVDPHELFVLQGSERVVLVRVVDGIGSTLARLELVPGPDAALQRYVHPQDHRRRVASRLRPSRHLGRSPGPVASDAAVRTGLPLVP